MRLKYHFPGCRYCNSHLTNFQTILINLKISLMIELYIQVLMIMIQHLAGLIAKIDDVQNYIMNKLEINDPAQVTDSMIDAALNSAGQLVIIPFQDLLNLGSEARMNIPGISENNWTWKFQWEQIPENLVYQNP